MKKRQNGLWWALLLLAFTAVLPPSARAQQQGFVTQTLTNPMGVQVTGTSVWFNGQTVGVGTTQLIFGPNTVNYIQFDGTKVFANQSGFVTGNIPISTVSVGQQSIISINDGRPQWMMSAGAPQTFTGGTVTGATTFQADVTTCGPNPQIDIRCFGASTASIHTTGTGNGTNLTVGSSAFATGNGVAVAGGGAACTLSTPAAPTVVPGESEGQTVLDAPMTAGVSGSSTYKYSIFSEDAFGCVTAGGPATTITTGTASLGKTSVALSAISLLNNALSFTSSAAHGLVQYAFAHITSTGSNSYFLSGWFNIQTITDATHAGAIQTVENSATTVTGTGGTLVYFIGNKVTFSAVANGYRYYVCAQRPGDGGFHIIGQALPGETQYDDFGFNLAQDIPWWITDANCTAGASQGRVATATITAGGGTTALSISPALSTAVTGVPVRLDNALALASAALAAKTNSALYIPSGTWELNSMSAFGGNNNVGIIQAGTLTINATLFPLNGWQWSGGAYKGWNGTLQFAASSPSLVNCNANPCFDLNQFDPVGTTLHNLTLLGNANGVLVAMAPNFTNGLDNIQYNTGNGNPTADVMGIAIWEPPGTPATTECDNCTFVGGPGQNVDQTWAPFVYLEGNAPSGDSAIILRSAKFGVRGVYAQYSGGSGGTIFCDACYQQGGITPFFAFSNNNGNVTTNAYLNQVHMDSSQQAGLAMWGIGGATLNGQYQIGLANSPQNDGGGNPAFVTGSAFNGAEWVGERVGDSGPSGVFNQGVGFKFDGVNLLPTHNLVPLVAGSNLGNLGTPWNLYVNQIIGPNTPWSWKGVEGSIGGCQAGFDVLGIGDLATHQVLECDNGGPLLPLLKASGSFTVGHDVSVSGTAPFDVVDNGVVPPNQGPNIIYVSTNCGTQANCFPVKADAKWATDAAFTNSSGLVTLSAANGDPPATPSDVNKICFGTSFVAATHTDVYVAYVIRIAQGTITSVTDSTHLTCSNIANAGGTGTFVWGSDDTANLNAAWAAASAVGQCKAFDLPAGGMMVQGAIGYTTSCQKSGIVSANDYEYAVFGKGMRNTLFVPTPNFSFTNCTSALIPHICFFGAAQGTTVRDLSVNGFGNCATSAPAGTGVFGIPLDDYPQNVDVDFWGCSDTNLSAWLVPNFMGSNAFNINSNGGGGTGLTAGTSSYTDVKQSFFCCSLTREVTIGSGATLVADSGTGFSGSGCGAAMFSVSGNFVANGSGFAGNCASGNNIMVDILSGGVGVFTSFAHFATLNSTDAQNVVIEAGGKAIISQSLFSAPADAASFCVNNATTTGILIDQGGNTCTNAGFALLGSFGGPGNGNNVQGFCTGTASSSSTLGLYGTGANEILSTCTSTTIGNGIPVNVAGKILGFAATASHAGVSPTLSGVMSVLKNGVATALTCTIGTGTSCTDFTLAHQVTVARGDLISYSFTTTAAEVLAGVQAQVVVW